MSFLPRGSGRLLRLLPAALLCGVLLPAFASGDQGYLPVSRPLPDVTVRALDSGEVVSLSAALAGRPAVVLVTEAGGAAACPAGTAAAQLQRDYGPWFSWVVVLSGPFTVPEIERVRESTPLRLERLYLDQAGALQAGLGVARLPALVLLDENGSVHDICAGSDTTARLTQTALRLQGIAAGSRRRHAGFEDFRLPQVGGSDLVSFLDVAGPEGTMLAFIHSNCLPCARQLGVLDYARDRHAGRVSFVTVFLDDAPDARIRGFLAAAGATPDFVLRDPELRLARRYAIEIVPAMLVIDADGLIVLSRNGYREEERDGLYRDLNAALALGALSADPASPALGAARRLHEEACAFLREGKPQFALLYQERIREMLPEYHSVNLRIAEAAIAAGNRDVAIRSLARYLAAQPQTYDSSQIRGIIAGLLEPSP